MENKPKLSIIIVTYQSGNCIGELISEFDNIKNIEFEIQWVDNGSDIENKKIYQYYLKKYCNRIKLNLNWLNNNIGYSSAVNLALTKTSSEYILLINPDVCLNTNWISYLENIVTEVIYDLASTKSINKFMKIDNNLRRYPGLRKNIFGDSNLPNNIFNLQKYYIDFSCIIIKRALFLKYGDLYNYFLYGEDVEFMSRLRYEKLKIIFDNSIYYKHNRSNSSFKVDSNKYCRIIYSDAHNFIKFNEGNKIKILLFFISLVIGALPRIIYSNNKTLQFHKLQLAIKFFKNLNFNNIYDSKMHVQK